MFLYKESIGSVISMDETLSIDSNGVNVYSQDILDKITEGYEAVSIDNGYTQVGDTILKNGNVVITLDENGCGTCGCVESTGETVDRMCFYCMWKVLFDEGIEISKDIGYDALVALYDANKEGLDIVPKMESQMRNTVELGEIHASYIEWKDS